MQAVSVVTLAMQTFLLIYFVSMATETGADDVPFQLFTKY